MLKEGRGELRNADFGFPKKRQGDKGSGRQGELRIPDCGFLKKRQGDKVNGRQGELRIPDFGFPKKRKGDKESGRQGEGLRVSFLCSPTSKAKEKDKENCGMRISQKEMRGLGEWETRRI